MNFLPKDRKRFLINLALLAGLVLVAFLVYAANKAEKVADDLSNQTATVINQISSHISIETNFGKIEIELYPDKAPKTVANFIKLAGDHFYDNTKFHRVIPDFMIQGGDPLSKDNTQKMFWGTGGPGYMFQDEPNDIELTRGVLAMANSGPNTNGSQFFIITASATPWLQGKHTAFGKVTSGMDVVETISKLKTETNDRPLEDVIVERIVLK